MARNFRDDLSKFVHRYPYTNYHELVLDFLLDRIQAIQELIEGIDFDTIEEQLQTLTDELTTIKGIINDEDIGNIALKDSIDDISSVLEGIIQKNISQDEAITELDEIATQLASEIDSHEVRIEALEEAAFGDLSFSGTAYNELASDFRYPSLVDYEIYDLEDNLLSDGTQEILSSYSIVMTSSTGNFGIAPNNITSRDARLITFKTSGTGAYLKIKNFMSFYYLANAPTDKSMAVALLHYQTAALAEWRSSDLYSFKQWLDGITVASPGSTTYIFRDMKLAVNQETGNYDLYIYNGLNGRYTNSQTRILYLIGIDHQRQADEDLMAYIRPRTDPGLSEIEQIEQQVNSLRTGITNIITELANGADWMEVEAIGPGDYSYIIRNRSYCKVYDYSGNTFTEVNINMTFETSYLGQNYYLGEFRCYNRHTGLYKVIKFPHAQALAVNYDKDIGAVATIAGYTAGQTQPGIHLNFNRQIGSGEGGQARITGHLIFPGDIVNS